MKIEMWGIALLIALFALPLSAQETAETKAAEPAPYDIIQLAVWDGIGSNQNEAVVTGLRIGLPVCGGEAPVYGIEIGVLGAASRKVYGFQWGVLASIADSVNGLQVSLVNVAKTNSFQIGLINYIEDSPLPVFPFVNIKF